MKILVGYTGFVGSNIVLQADFDGLYNSKNVEHAFGTKPDLLIYSGVRAEKYLANKNPENDYRNIKIAISNIQRISPKMLVLISTIDVYRSPIDVDEDTLINTDNLHPYGFNRYYLETWVEENIRNHLIIRLPGLYGKNIKKNFIFDIINVIPYMLNEDKFNELCSNNDYIKDYYIIQDNGFYKCKDMIQNENYKLKTYFNRIGFSAINFTDSRACFQFYNLTFLWEHIQKALAKSIKKLNLSTEPIAAGELYKYIKGINFINEISITPAKYDFKTKYSDLFGGKNGYVFDKYFVLEDIKRFIEGYES